MTKRLGLTLLLLIGFLGTSAWADTTVSYYTTHTLGDPTVPGTGISLSFTDWTQNNLVVKTVPGYAFSKLGTFVIDQCDCGGTATYQNVPFSLTVHQSVPSLGTSDFTAVLNGDIYFDGSTTSVAFDHNTIQIGDVIYTLTQQSYSLNAADGESEGLTTIQAQVTVVPEPGSLALLGSGLLGAGGFLRRRFLA